MGILQIPVKKVKGAVIEVDTDKLPEAVYEYALVIGLKEIAARGMTKVKKENYPTEQAFNDSILAIAKEQIELAYAGKTRMVGAKASKGGKAQGALMTEMIRLAKLSAIAQLKAAGIKVSLVSAADKTKAAKALIEADPETWAKAAQESLSKANVPHKGVDILAMVHEDPNLAAKKEKAKKEKAAAKTPKVPGAVAAKPKQKPSNNPKHA